MDYMDYIDYIDYMDPKYQVCACSHGTWDSMDYDPS